MSDSQALEKRVIPIGGLLTNTGETYQCQHDWPPDCQIQCGGNGIVYTEGSMQDAFENPVETLAHMLEVAPDPPGSYRTAFFEAFPRDPDTFIRGEGKTVLEAEKAAWGKLEKYRACEHPAFEKRGYENGAGFCVECGFFAPGYYAPWEKCKHCNYPVYPGSLVCFHCQLFVETGENDSPIWGKYRQRDRQSAQWLVAQPLYCPDCQTHVADMRLISPSDHRLTEDEKVKQDRLYHAVFNRAMSGKRLFDEPDPMIVFPASLFYECKCDSLKLISDLEEIGQGGNDG